VGTGSRFAGFEFGVFVTVEETPGGKAVLVDTASAAGEFVAKLAAVSWL
jgi:hypothetical protein